MSMSAQERAELTALRQRVEQLEQTVREAVSLAKASKEVCEMLRQEIIDGRGKAA